MFVSWLLVHGVTALSVPPCMSDHSLQDTRRISQSWDHSSKDANVNWQSDRMHDYISESKRDLASWRLISYCECDTSSQRSAVVKRQADRVGVELCYAAFIEHSSNLTCDECWLQRVTFIRNWMPSSDSKCKIANNIPMALILPQPSVWEILVTLVQPSASPSFGVGHHLVNFQQWTWWLHPAWWVGA